ncbi:peptidase A22B, signal peptide peptidase [Tricholoma matsutake]|nr:peptidase A22B, signal peptide peptidase [Tricholoma matsutake 945]
MGGTDWGLLSSYAGLLTLATGSIYAGAFGSLPNSKKSDKNDEDQDHAERLSSDDALFFPIIASGALVGLYTIIKYLGAEWINWFLGWYFSIVGVGSVWKSVISLMRYCLGSTRWKQFDSMNFSIKKGSKSLLSMTWKTPSLFLFPLAIIPSAIYSFSPTKRKSVLITDILSLSFSHNALSLMKIDSFQTGSILLSSLFLYDIWWVFGTEVMVKVATSLDIPIKLLWPKSLTFSDAHGFTMLGLGDVVIPGIFIGLCLRWDFYRSRKTNSGDSFSKPYFYASMMAYMVGLITTMSVMHIFGKAQPALLYLSPTCILSLFITAMVRGELGEVWNWSDKSEEDKKSKSS